MKPRCKILDRTCKFSKFWRVCPISQRACARDPQKGNQKSSNSLEIPRAHKNYCYKFLLLSHISHTSTHILMSSLSLPFTSVLLLLLLLRCTEEDLKVLLKPAEENCFAYRRHKNKKRLTIPLSSKTTEFLSPSSRVSLDPGKPLS